MHAISPFSLLGVVVALCGLNACGGSNTEVKSDLEREIDTNNDGKTDIWQILATSDGRLHLAEKRFDLNFDGKVDVVRIFDVDSNEIENRLDLDFDGKFDVTAYLKNGQIIRKEYDANFDGKPDIFQFYTDGILREVERDLNFDGKIDHWEHFDDQGLLEKAESDDDGDGKPDTEADPFELDQMPSTTPTRTQK